MDILDLDEVKEKMTSLVIAELTGKNHKDVMRSIRNMEKSWLNIAGRKFALISYIFPLHNVEGVPGEIKT